MALAATLDQEGYEALDEVLQGQYSESNGKWVLEVDGIKEHPTVSGLQKAYEAEKRRANDRSEKLKAFGDLTPEDIETLRAEVEELRDSKNSDLIAPEELQALKDRVKDLGKRAKEAEELEKRVDFFERDQKTRLRNEIRGELLKAGAKKEAVPAAAALILSEHKGRYERGEDGFMPVVTGDLNGVPGDHNLTEFVSEWVKGPGAWALPATGKGGSGADPTNRTTPDVRSGVKQIKMEGTTVRADPRDILEGKAVVVQN